MTFFFTPNISVLYSLNKIVKQDCPVSRSTLRWQSSFVGDCMGYLRLSVNVELTGQGQANKHL
jgi:hypothetical protein